MMLGRIKRLSPTEWLATLDSLPMPLEARLGSEEAAKRWLELMGGERQEVDEEQDDAT